MATDVDADTATYATAAVPVKVPSTVIPDVYELEVSSHSVCRCGGIAGVATDDGTA